MKYGKAIKIIRSAKGITQKKLAEISNLDKSYISRIESEERAPTLESLEKISKALNVPLHCIILLSSNKKDINKSDSKDKIAMKLLKLFMG